MQPYSYFGYPNAAGPALPMHYPVPMNYQPTSPRILNRSFDPYARVPIGIPAVRYVAQRIQYAPPPPIQTVVPIIHPPPPLQTLAPIVPPPQSVQTVLPSASPRRPVRTVVPIASPRRPAKTVVPIAPPPQPQVYSQPFQYAPAYYHDPNYVHEVRPSAPPNPKSKKGPPKQVQIEEKKKHTSAAPAPNSLENQLIKGINANSNAKDLLNQKGTKVRLSKMYRISKTKPDFQDDSDDEFERVTLAPSPVRTFKQPSPRSRRLSEQIRVPSATSSYSHCSTCSNCSCSECRHKNTAHPYDDCSHCRAERQREQTQMRRHRQN